MMIAYNRDKIYKLAWLIRMESLICIYGKTMETDLPCFLSCVHELSYVSGEQVNGDINVLLKCYDLKKVLLSHSVVNRRAGSFFSLLILDGCCCFPQHLTLEAPNKNHSKEGVLFCLCQLID